MEISGEGAYYCAMSHEFHIEDLENPQEGRIVLPEEILVYLEEPANRHHVETKDVLREVFKIGFTVIEGTDKGGSFLLRDAEGDMNISLFTEDSSD